MEVAAPTVVPHVTEPLWRLPFAGTRTDRGALSEGFSNEVATYFVVKLARNLHGLIVPHNWYQIPHFRQLMGFDSPRNPTCAIGFEREFVQHRDRLTTHPSFSWEKGEVENMGSSLARTCGSVISRDYPTTCIGARIPQLDEETGRVVQELIDGWSSYSSTQLLFT